jgi:quercetin dioxygenase-like cupin family protein
LGIVLASCAPAAEQATAPDEAAPALAEAPVTHLAQDADLQWGACTDIFPAGCEIAVLHGNPAQPNADVFLRVPGGYTLPAHSHTSAERMVLVSGELNVHYQGAEATLLSAGEYAFGPAGLAHVGTCLSAEPCTLFIAFEGPIDALPFEGAIE